MLLKLRECTYRTYVKLYVFIWRRGGAGNVRSYLKRNMSGTMWLCVVHILLFLNISFLSLIVLADWFMFLFRYILFYIMCLNLNTLLYLWQAIVSHALARTYFEIQYWRVLIRSRKINNGVYICTRGVREV